MEFDTDKFIIEIQSRQSLWNTKCPDYSDRNVKQREWEEIVNIYGAELSSEEKKQLGMNLQKKWRNIRDCFVKAHKAKEAPNGSAAKKKYPYIFYDSLLFLKNTVSVNSTASNITLNSEPNNEDDIEEDRNIAVHSESSWAPKRNKKNNNHDVGRELIGILTKSLETKNVEVDEDRFFFLSLVQDFKKVPEHLRTKTKLDILKVIQDSQFSNYPNTWDYPYRGHHSTQHRNHPYTRTQTQTPVTTSSQETIVNDSILVQSPLSSAETMAAQE